MVTKTSNNKFVIRYTAFTDYATYKMGPSETIFTFKERFDSKYKAYVDQGNANKDPEDKTMNFLRSLNQSKYGSRIVSYLNGISTGSMKAPATLNKVYARANETLELRKSVTHDCGASF